MADAISIPTRWVFFFQAEDGIRDVAVTGVQTCALPIFETALTKVGGELDVLNETTRLGASVTNRQCPPVVTPLGPEVPAPGRTPANPACSCATNLPVLVSTTSTAKLERSAR